MKIIKKHILEILYATFMVVAIFCIFGCNAKKNIVTAEYKRDSVYFNDHYSNMRYDKDSIYIYNTVYQKGDTVYNTKIEYKLKYNSIHDTIIKDRIEYKEKIKENTITINKKYIPKWIKIVLFISIVLNCLLGLFLFLILKR